METAMDNGGPKARPSCIREGFHCISALLSADCHRYVERVMFLLLIESCPTQLALHGVS